MSRKNIHGWRNAHKEDARDATFSNANSKRMRKDNGSSRGGDGMIRRREGRGEDKDKDVDDDGDETDQDDDDDFDDFDDFDDEEEEEEHERIRVVVVVVKVVLVSPSTRRSSSFGRLKRDRVHELSPVDSATPIFNFNSHLSADDLEEFVFVHALGKPSRGRVEWKHGTGV